MNRVLAVLLLLGLSTSSLAQEVKAEAEAEVAVPVGDEVPYVEDTGPIDPDLEPAPVSQPGVLYFAPLSLLFGNVSVEYERPLSQGVSFFVAPAVSLPFGITAAALNAVGALSGVTYSYFGAGVTTGARFYLTQDAPRGFFVGPELTANFLSLSASGSGASATASGVGFAAIGVLGYALINEGGFAFSGGIGGGVGGGGVSASASSGGETASTTASVPIGFAPSLRLHFGFAI